MWIAKVLLGGVSNPAYAPEKHSGVSIKVDGNPRIFKISDDSVKFANIISINHIRFSFRLYFSIMLIKQL